MSEIIHYSGHRQIIAVEDLTDKTDAKMLIRISRICNWLAVKLDRNGYTKVATTLFEVSADLFDDAEFQINEIFETENQKEPLDLSVYFTGKPEV